MSDGTTGGSARSPRTGAKETQREFIERLAEVEDSSPVHEVTVDVWGERLCRCECCLETHTGRAVVETVEELLSWGAAYDATAAPFFEHTSRQSAVTGNCYEGIVPPRVTAALSVDGTVRGVFPCAFAGDTYTVHDVCDVLDGTIEVDAGTDSLDSTV